MMRGFRGLLAAALALGFGTAPPHGAWAQSTPEDDQRKETVLTRDRPELDPLGLRLGSFLLYPALTLGLEFDDNIYRTERSRDADIVTRIVPRFRLASDWNNHALEVAGSADFGLHGWNESEDYSDAAIGFDGRIDYTRATKIFGGAHFEHLHEDRGTPDGSFGREPTEFDRAGANIGVSHRWNRLSLTGEGRYVNLDYDDTPAAGGSINNDDRDRNVYVAAARVGYEIVPRFEAFLRSSYNVRDYRTRRDDFGIDRDSDGYEIVLGTQFDLTGITYGEVYAGYRAQHYQDSSLRTIDGLTFGARLTSNITTLTTAQLVVDRDIEETSIVAGEGYWSTSVRATVDHELLRNLILSGAVGYNWNEYQGADRDDHTFRATLGANYLMNRYLTVGASYDFEWRESTGRAAGVDYTSNRFLLKVTAHF